MADDLPILCEKCGIPWVDCACGDEACCHHIAAFRGIGNKVIRVYALADCLFIEEAGKTSLFAETDFTTIAQAWLAHQQEDDDEDHQHHFMPSLASNYTVCSCGAFKAVALR